jgi:hypothetical protein
VPQHVVDWVRAGGTVLLDAQATLADLPPSCRCGATTDGSAGRRRRVRHGRLMRLTQSLAPQDMPVLLDGDFPRVCARCSSRFRRTGTRVGRDHAPTTGAAAFPPIAARTAAVAAGDDRAAVAIERWMATGPRRGVAP